MLTEAELIAALPVLNRAAKTWRIADPEDIVQTAVLKGWRFRHLYRGGSPEAWLLTIMKRVWLTSLRRDRPEVSVSALVIDPPQEIAVLAKEVADCIAGLTCPGAVLLMDSAEGCGYPEIAERHGISQALVRSRLHHARASVREAFA